MDRMPRLLDRMFAQGSPESVRWRMVLVCRVSSRSRQSAGGMRRGVRRQARVRWRCIWAGAYSRRPSVLVGSPMRQSRVTGAEGDFGNVAVEHGLLNPGVAATPACPRGMGDEVGWLEGHVDVDRAAAAQAPEPERERRCAGLSDVGGVCDLGIGAKPIRRIVEAGVARTVCKAPRGPHGGE